MTFTSIISRLTNNFVSRLTLLFSKTTHLNFWKNVLPKDEVTQASSYNLAPLVGVIIGFIIAFIAILGRLVFDYRIIAAIIAFACYLFFGFTKALCGFTHLVGEARAKDVNIGLNINKLNANRLGIIFSILAVVLWCIAITYMRSARLFLSLMSSICISRFAACVVAYIGKYTIQEDTEPFDKVDLVVAMICTAPWLIFSLERCLVNLIFATTFAVVVTRYMNRNWMGSFEKISGAAIVVSEVFSLLIWLI